MLLKLGSFVQLVPNVSSSKITQYGLAKMHRLNVKKKMFFLPSPTPQSINVLKHIQYFVKHNVKCLFSISPPWAIKSEAFKFYSEGTEVK